MFRRPGARIRLEPCSERAKPEIWGSRLSPAEVALGSRCFPGGWRPEPARDGPGLDGGTAGRSGSPADPARRENRVRPRSEPRLAASGRPRPSEPRSPASSDRSCGTRARASSQSDRLGSSSADVALDGVARGDPTIGRGAVRRHPGGSDHLSERRARPRRWDRAPCMLSGRSRVSGEPGATSRRRSRRRLSRRSPLPSS